jgi:hypothetical protein
MTDNPYQPPQVEQLAEPPLPEGVIPSRTTQFKLTDAPTLLVGLLVTFLGLVFSMLSWGCSAVGL